MSFNNIIAIVGDKFDAINLISSKLVLLRDLDKVTDTNLENAVSFLSQTMPNVIIIHAKGDSEDSLNTIKDIKKTELLSNIPILLYSEDCTKEFLIDAFDVGISDIIKAPVDDWELLIRVIWCIQKNEITLNTNTKNNFLTNLGIMQDKTGFYTEEYAEQFLKSEIDSAIKYKIASCLMLVGPDGKFPPFKGTDILDEVIKKSIRINDSVGIRKDGKYYIYLPKTRLNGAYAVFERINNNLGLDLSTNAAVAEIKDKDFSEVKNMLEGSFEKTKGNTNTLLVAHEILSGGILGQDKEEEKRHTSDIIERRLNIKEAGKEGGHKVNLFKKADGSTDFAKDTLLSLKGNEDFSTTKPDNLYYESIKKDKDENISQKSFLASRTAPTLPDIKDTEFTEEEERNANLFRQAFKKKCELVTKPVFDKFKLQVEGQHKFIDVNKNVEFTQSFFELRKDDKLMRLTVNYPGFSKVEIVTEIFFGSERKGYNAFSLNLTEYGFHKLSITLEGLINEFESYL